MAIPPLNIIRDPKRLATLEDYGIIGTPPEPAFDDIVQVAKELCHTPVALISFVEADRQWFKAIAGFEACETPLNQSVCAHALDEESTLVIPDLSTDPRTMDNPLVLDGPRIRFYAGALLRAPNGEPLGTLCVIDDKPRPEGLTDVQLSCLQALARQVCLIMDQRKAIETRNAALQSSRTEAQQIHNRALISEAATELLRSGQARLRAAQEAGRVGTFDVDIAADVLYCSGEMCRMFGLPDAEAYPVTAFTDLVLAEDRDIASTVATRRHGIASSYAEYRIQRASDKSVRWLSRRGEFIRSSTGEPVRFTGTIQDITGRKANEIKQAVLLSLADELREANSADGAITVAARALGENLVVSIAGYAVIDIDAGIFKLEGGWAKTGVERLIGVFTPSSFHVTVSHLKRGAALVTANVSSVGWLGADIETYKRLGVRSLIAIPFVHHGKLGNVFFVFDDMPRNWRREEIDFAEAVADLTYATVARLRAEEDQRFLNIELSHRLKNSLAVVQAIASQTLRNANDKEAVDAFRKRLSALSKAHDILLQQSWTSARLKPLIEGLMELHVDLARVHFNGPNVTIGPKAVLSLSLLMNELSTNAVKYGALSSLNGQVEIAWRIEGNPQPPTFVMTWTESGGPLVAEPQTQGLGTRLIKAGISGTGHTVLRYEQSGFFAEFRAPFALIADN